MGVARPTIVHALHRLAETGLISILPRRGVLVAPVDVLDVQQVFDARIAIEGALAALAAVRATQVEVQALRELQAEVERLKEAKLPKEVGTTHPSFLDLDERLHLRIAAVARNRFLQSDLERVWKVNSRLWHVFFRVRGTKADYFLSHSEIIVALERNDPDAAREAVRQHLRASKEMLLSGLWGG
jgi:DNA-binding GntR family transcriptional regulator